jgi:hypothetical protein
VTPLSRPSLRPEPEDAPFRHLIAQYVHRLQAVRCTCGFEGSSASPDGKPSEWDRHIRANRTVAALPVI